MLQKSYTNAERLASAVEQLGPTYVKFAQAVSSRPDIVPKSLADALSVLQDDMIPFDSATAKQIIRSELTNRNRSNSNNNNNNYSTATTSSGGGGQQNTISAIFEKDPGQLELFLQSLSVNPIAAASVGQVFSGTLPGFGKVAVKVQRPGIREIVERDAQLLRSVATWIESVPAISLFPGKSAADKDDDDHGDTIDLSSSNSNNNRLIATELVSSVDEFMSRLFEELDYHNEANNMEKFASLYSVRRGTAKQQTKVVVPEVLLDLCTDNVIVMEYIEGTKLTNVVNNEGDVPMDANANIAENLALVELCIDCTLSQLLDTGVMHADPHGGNLLKVKHPTTNYPDPYAVKETSKRKRIRKRLQQLKSSLSSGINTKELPQLGYLDFGMLSVVDPTVRDALVCAIVLLVFSRDVDRVANLFGELQLLPDEVVNSTSEMRALAQSLDQMFDDILTYPDNNDDDDNEEATKIPTLRFDKLLDYLVRLVPRFKFDLPPYFTNNARALSTLEGIARSLDPSFSVLQVVYPYALNRLLKNPSRSQVVDDTLQTLMRSKETGRIDRGKVDQMLDDAALITGFKRRKVLTDILKTRGGLRLMRMMVLEGLGDVLGLPQRSRRRSF